jgi:hypothetical protein
MLNQMQPEAPGFAIFQRRAGIDLRGLGDVEFGGIMGCR